MFIVALIALAASLAHAAESDQDATRGAEPIANPTPKPVKPPKPVPALDEDRDPFRISYAYSPIGLLMPVKHGPAFSYRDDNKWAYEASYFSGSFELSTSVIDIGSFKESLIIANGRYFTSNGSFNLIVGLSRQSYEARLGSDLLGRLNPNMGGVDLLSVQTLGLQLGLGNLWSLGKGFSIGVDWFVLNFPFLTLKNSAPVLDYVGNSDDRRRIEDALKVMRYLPTAAFFKANLGYSF